MRIFLNSLLTISLLALAAPSAAQDRATEIAISPIMSPDFHACYRIDARREWQRVTTKRGGEASIVVLSNLTGTQAQLDSLTPPYRWSVDDARFARVGPEGHTGSAAQALEPFSGFKFLKNEPFGALIFRANNVDPQAYPLISGSARFPEGTQWIDFRINDTGLGDNGGGMQLCVAQGL